MKIFTTRTNTYNISVSNWASIGLILICLVMNACVTLQPVEFRRVDNMQVLTNKFPPSISLDLYIYNPNSYGLTLTEISTELNIDDKKIGNIILPKKTRIYRKKETPVPFTIELSTENLMKLLPAALSGFSKSKSNGSLKGYIKLRKFIFTQKIQHRSF